ncbi:hypothetical protein OEA41_006597 [Lepraria neglecta]|uniref:Uncharacterized protein n=1 Tax=Lepraria neglecta TaxID=209136 RepID=A0AAD9Z993_9LECA|nr:hypothetical protein OEA41_006597 [Lepraria neglecta]
MKRFGGRRLVVENAEAVTTATKKVANIDISSSPLHAPSTPASHGGPTAPSSTQSTPRSVKPRSDINKQIYQFALGYPQTPPETSPVLEYGRSELQTGLSGVGEKMGGFIFKWCV